MRRISDNMQRVIYQQLDRQPDERHRPAYDLMVRISFC